MIRRKRLDHKQVSFSGNRPWPDQEQQESRLHGVGIICTSGWARSARIIPPAGTQR